MVPEHFERDWENALFFHEQGIPLPTEVHPIRFTASKKVVDGYTEDNPKRLWNGMPQRAYTESKRKWQDLLNNIPSIKGIMGKNDASVPWHMQVELQDSKGKKWYMDQAERFNAFNFNNFEGWACNAGYSGLIIREPDGSVKRSYPARCIPATLKQVSNYLRHQNLYLKSCVSSADSKIIKRKING